MPTAPGCWNWSPASSRRVRATRTWCGARRWRRRAAPSGTRAHRQLLPQCRCLQRARAPVLRPRVLSAGRGRGARPARGGRGHPRAPPVPGRGPWSCCPRPHQQRAHAVALQWFALHWEQLRERWGGTPPTGRDERQRRARDEPPRPGLLRSSAVVGAMTMLSRVLGLAAT
jgi:hypothetical protein